VLYKNDRMNQKGFFMLEKEKFDMTLILSDIKEQKYIVF